MTAYQIPKVPANPENLVLLEQQRRAARRFNWPVWPFYILQLVVLGVGIGAVGGTVLQKVSSGPYNFAAFQPMRQDLTTATPQLPEPHPETQTEPPAAVDPEPITLNQEIPALKQKIEDLIAQSADVLTLGVFLLDLDDYRYVDVGGTGPFSAASTIKVPVLVAFFHAVDAGEVRLDEVLTMGADVIGSGAGWMQYQPVNSQFSALQTAEEMIIVSDNTATNMLIQRLGGQDLLNQRFAEWGLENTVLRNPLPDLEGTNTTSPQDLTYLLSHVANGHLVSLRSRDRILDIMQQTLTKTLLPQGIEKSARISHKTGDIGSSVGDTGLIDIPNGKRYAVTALVKRPHNDNRAQELIRQTSRTIYNHLKHSIPDAPQHEMAVASENGFISEEVS